MALRRTLGRRGILLAHLRAAWAVSLAAVVTAWRFNRRWFQRRIARPTTRPAQ